MQLKCGVLRGAAHHSLIMRSAKSFFLFSTALVVAVGCGSSAVRDGFDDQSQTGDPTDPGGSSGSSGAGSSGGFGGGGQAAALTLDPKNATVFIDTALNPTVPGTLTFKALDQGGKDVAGSTTFTLEDGSLGSFSGATFTSLASLPMGTLGKSTKVTAKGSAGTALGSLTVVALRKTGDSRDFFFSVPYQDAPSPKSDTLKFSTNIKQADVAFSMDTTGSMAGSIDALKTSLAGSLLGSLQTAIPNVGLGIIDFRDQGDAWVALVRQPITTNLASAQAAVNAMSAGGGGDGPEASISSMQFILDGKANPIGIGAHTNTVPGTYGGADFRAGSVPVVVNVTDAEWHDPSGNASMSSLIAAFGATKAKFVGISVGFDESQANALSDATASNVPPSAFAGCAAGKCCTGNNGAPRNADGPGGTCRLNFLASGGTGLGNSVVQAISAIAVGTTFDVKAQAANDPKNAGGVDATKFIKALRAMDEGSPANGCPAAAAKDSDGDGIKDTFLAVKAGTPVCFEVIANTNTTVPSTIDPQFFNAYIDVMGLPGNLKLDTRSVLFLVPPTVSGVK
ncbi:MAG: hypothetical protein JWP97_6280 [Labilithrix sp.]|nr:hypothetical protein [Labilithrix sp.]